MKKRHDLEYCGIICRHTNLQSCCHPKFPEPRKFDDGKLTREFPEWCPLPDEHETNILSSEEFIKLVREMRRLQTGYFATRDKGLLVASKMREKEVDEAIMNYCLKISGEIRKEYISEKIRSFPDPECAVDAEPKDDHPKLF